MAQGGLCRGSWILLISCPKLWVSSARSRLLFSGLVDEPHLKVIVSPAELIISYSSRFSPVSVLSPAYVIQLSSHSKGLLTARLFPAVCLPQVRSVSIPALWHLILIWMANFTGKWAGRQAGSHSVFLNTVQAIVLLLLFLKCFNFVCLTNKTEIP